MANSALTNTVTAPSSKFYNWTPLGSNVSAWIQLVMK